MIDRAAINAGPEGGAGQATLLFGVGATKAGTSWLYRFLASHPECHLRTIKELHFYDTLDRGNLEFQSKQFLTKHAALLARREQVPAGDPRRRYLRRQIADLEAYLPILEAGDEAQYLSYLSEGRGQMALFADVTPAYSLLSVDRLKSMAALAPVTRFVYLMRDPVSRLWSHVRMMANRAAKAGQNLAGHAARIFDNALAGKARHVTDRGDYAGALDRLDAALDPKALFLGFYEELFSAEAIDRLCAFLGITPAEARFDKRVHEGVKIDMTADQRSRAAAYLRPQYDYVLARMGRLPAKWEANYAGV